MENKKKRLLTPSQVQKMKHAVGLKPWMIQGGERVHLYRKFYSTGPKGDPDWDDLVRRKMAIKKDLLPNSHERVYVLTDSGLKFLETILHIKFLRDYA